MEHTIQDRGYFSAGSIERIEYPDGEIAHNPVYAKIDTLLYGDQFPDAAYSCLVEALWVEDDGSVRVRRVPAEQMRIVLRGAEAPEEPNG